MLVDCSYGAGYDACQGGWPTAAWEYIKANGGVAPEAFPLCQVRIPIDTQIASMTATSCPVLCRCILM